MTPTQQLAERVREMCRDKINELRGHRDITPAPIYEALSRAIGDLGTLDLSPLYAVPDRDAVIEECAKTAEGRIQGWNSSEIANHEARKIAECIRALAQETGNWAHCRHGSCRNERECRWPESCDYKAGLDKPVTTAPTAGGLPEEPPNIEFLAENIPVGESRTIRLEMPEPVVKRSDYNKLRTAAEALQAENVNLKQERDDAKHESKKQHAKNSEIYGRLCKAEQSAAQLREQLAAARALLQEWLDTELDSMDEEYEPWIESFTERVTAAIQAAERGEKET